MNNQKLWLLVAPGLTLLLLLSLRSVMALATINSPTVINEAGIDVAKVPPGQAVLPGQNATFTIYITNTGSEELALTVQDPQGDPNCETPPVNSLAANDSIDYVCTKSEVTANFDNVIDVTGTYGEEMTVQASALATVEVVDAAIDVALSPDSQVVPHNGTAVYNITIRNEGQVPLDLSAEALHGDDNCQPGLPSLGPGESTNYDCTASAVTADLTDLVVITGSHTTAAGNLVKVSGSAQPIVLSEPLITVTKTADPIAVQEPGGPVIYTVTISSAGGDNVVLVSLMDDIFGNLRDPNNGSVSDNNCPDIVDIGGGEQVTCSFTAQVSGQPGNHINTITALVEENGPGELQATDDDSATVTIEDVPSSIVTTLTAAPTSVPAPGGNVVFTVRVENSSAMDTVTIHTLTGSPPLADLNGEGNCSVPKTLVVGGSYECSATFLVEGESGQTRSFTVIATGEDDDGVEVAGASDPVQITIGDRPPTRLFLPLALNNFLPNVPDEPNNTCAAAHGIVINTDYSFLPNDKEDWYRFNLASSGNLIVELTNFVPVQGQIIVYKGSCPALQFLKNNGNFSSTKIVNVGPVTPGTYFVRVITDGPFSSTPYNLRIHFP